MDKFLKMLLFSLIVWFINFCSACNCTMPTKFYVNLNNNLTLPCTLDNYSTGSWEGPCNTAGCKITNTTTYFDGLQRSTEVPQAITVQTANHKDGFAYDLRISPVSKNTLGLYSCFGLESMVSIRRNFEVVLKVKPSDLVIKNMLNGKLHGTTGIRLDLICEVTSGAPLENMTWYKDESIVAIGGPAIVRHYFVPTPENDGQEFVCVVQSDALETPLKGKVKLDIKYRPVVQCIKEPISVIEGNILTVQCTAHSNPPHVVRITRDGVKIKECVQSPCSLKRTSSRNDSGIYWCTAQNVIGDGNTCQTNVKILYPPVVSVVILNDTTLRCRANGEPNNASYLSWQHYSEHGEVEHYKGSEYRELCSSCKRYKVNGVYRCSATNGIRHADGNDVSFGKVSVQLKGTPEILPKTKSKQYGKYKKAVTLEVFVYSTTVITIETISRNGEVIESSGRLATNGSYRNEHRATYTITVLQEVDFAVYAFKLKNDEKAISFNVSLVAKDVPEAPDIQQLTVKDSDIIVHFSDNFDGGLPQVFVLQYRSILNWTSVVINDTFDGVGSYIIQNLHVGHIYYFQIYSVNSVGKSIVSEVRSIKIPGDQSHHVLPYVFIATGIIVLLVITTLISMKVAAIKQCLRRRCNHEYNNSDHDQEGHNIDALVENQLYLAFDSISRNQQQNATVSGPRYVAAQNHGENSMQSRNLHYADLVFNPATQQFVIRGDDRTIYSEIDHSLVAQPLDSSDSEEEEIKNEDEDDFMSVEEVAEYMRERGMKPPMDD